MPPLYRKKPSSGAAPVDIKKTSSSNRHKKSRAEFKTPLLTKFKIDNFFKEKSEDNLAVKNKDVKPMKSSLDYNYSSVDTGYSSSSRTSSHTREVYISAENQDSTLVLNNDSLANDDVTVGSIDVQDVRTKMSPENEMSNQIVPSNSPSDIKLTSSSDIFGTQSSSELSMNDPAIKEAYLDFLEKKSSSPPQTNTASQSSNYSINDPVIKKMYIDFMENKKNKPAKINKRVKKPKQSNERTGHTEEQVIVGSQQKQKSTDVNKTKGKKTKKMDVSNIDIRFHKTPGTSMTLKTTKYKNKNSHKKNNMQDKSSKKITSNKESSNEMAEIEATEDVTSTLKFKSQKEKLEWVLEVSNVGLYVICDRCEKTRYLKDVVDPLQLPEKWYCENNPDISENACSYPQKKIPDDVEEKLIENLYNAGSIVWAHLQGYPWWPAMVDVCPDTEDFFWLDNLEDQKPTWYNVTYFDTSSVTRSWLRVPSIIPFQKYANPNKRFNVRVPPGWSHRLEKSIQMANEALKVPLMERLREYSFIYRFNKPINKPIGDKKHRREKGRKHNEKKVSNKYIKEQFKQVCKMRSEDSDVTTISNLLEFDMEPDIAIQELF